MTTAPRTTPRTVLEPAAQELADATADPPYLYDLGPDGARKVLDDLQSAPVEMVPVYEEWVTVPVAFDGADDVRVRVVKPQEAVDSRASRLPTVLYMHGGGWVLGNATTHDRLVRELAVGAGVAVAFVEYSRSPEAKYPVALEQGYAVAQWITRRGDSYGLDGSRLAVAGDSVGGNMTAALTLMAKDRGDVTFRHQSLYYPVTDAAMDTPSYAEFAEGPFLRARSMEWFWDAYTTDYAQRREVTASPLRASRDQLAGLPPAYVCVDEADVLRDEGELYAAQLREAGVPVTTVRYDGIHHDFMMLNPLRDTRAARAALRQAVAELRSALVGR